MLHWQPGFPFKLPLIKQLVCFLKNQIHRSEARLFNFQNKKATPVLLRCPKIVIVPHSFTKEKLDRNVWQSTPFQFKRSFTC